MLRVLMASSEAAPFAKTGGLADVLGALPAALRQLGHDTAVVLPRYASVPLDDAALVWEHLPVALGAHVEHCRVWRLDRNGVPHFFIDSPPLFQRDGLYGTPQGDFPDNHLRFAAFSLAALAVLRHLFQADILHLHDWQSALAAAYRRFIFPLDPILGGVKTVFTIHNLEYQGRFAAGQFAALGLPRELLTPEGMEFHGDVSFMKAGIVYSDAITTVSPTYAREIQTPAFGCGLDGLLRAHAGRLTGILNGIDDRDWDPATDPALAAHYSAADPSGKRACKAALIAETGLPAARIGAPLLGIVSRFARQKGFELFAAIAGELFSSGEAALVFLGSGEPAIEDFFRGLLARFPDHVRGVFGYNAGLARRIEAGADLFLMPSLFEPCGLNQMYSMRYGTVPIVRATGGLADTVGNSTGYSFNTLDPGDLLAAIRQALAGWRDRDGWRRRMLAGMSRDFSWKASATRYSDLYANL